MPPTIVSLGTRIIGTGSFSIPQLQKSLNYMGAWAASQRGLDFRPRTALGPSSPLISIKPQNFATQFTTDVLLRIARTSPVSAVYTNDALSDTGHFYAIHTAAPALSADAITRVDGLGNNLMRVVQSMFVNGGKEVPQSLADEWAKRYEDGTTGATLPASLLDAPSEAAKNYKLNLPFDALGILGRYSIVKIDGHRIIRDGSTVIHTFTASTTLRHPLDGHAQWIVHYDLKTRKIQMVVVGVGEHPCRSIDAVNNIMAGPLFDTMFTLAVAAVENAPELAARFGEDFILRSSEPEIREALLSKVNDSNTRTSLYMLEVADKGSSAGVVLKSYLLNGSEKPDKAAMEQVATALTEAAAEKAPLLSDAQSTRLINDVQSTLDTGEGDDPSGDDSGSGVLPSDSGGASGHDPGHASDPGGHDDTGQPEDPIEPSKDPSHHDSGGTGTDPAHEGIPGHEGGGGHGR